MIFKYIRNVGFLDSFLFLGYLINPLGYGFIFGYFLIISIVFKKKFLSENFDITFMVLLFFSLSYGLFYSLTPDAGTQFTIVYMFTPPFFYIWGKYLISKSPDDWGIFYVLITAGFIFSLPSLISVLINILEGGFVQGSRSIPMFWSDEAKNATGMAAPFIFNMCIPALLVASFKKMGVFLKILMIAIFVLTVVCVLRLGSRTQLVIALMTFLLTLIYVIPKQTLKQNIGLFVLLGLGIFLVFKNVSFDWDADWLSSFAGRMEQDSGSDIASGGGRTDRWVKSIHNIFEKPFGWDVKEFGYSHNLWFDTLRVGGVVCFSLLLLFSWKSLIKVLKVIKLKSSNTSFSILALTYFTAFNLLFMVEPVLDGSIPIFVLFCIFIGIMNKYHSMGVVKEIRS